MLELRQITALLIAGIVLQVAVQVFGGASATMIAPDQTGTDAAIASAAASSTGPPTMTQTSQNSYLYLGTGLNKTAGEKVVSTSSLLYDLPVTGATVSLAKIGAPQGNITFGVWDNSGSLTKTIGTLNATSLTGSDASYSKTSTQYNLAVNQRIGIKYVPVNSTNNYSIHYNGTQYAQASANTVFDVTTGNFSGWGSFYRNVDTGAEEDLVRKKTSGTGAGYAVVITSGDLLQFLMSNGTTNVVATIASPNTIQTNVWYTYGFTVDRNASATVWLYNRNTGNYFTSSTSAAAAKTSLTTTQVWTLGRSSTGASSFLKGNFDNVNMLIGGNALTTAQFVSLVNDPTAVTPTSRYKFDQNGNDSVGSNNLTLFLAPTYNPSNLGDNVRVAISTSNPFDGTTSILSGSFTGTTWNDVSGSDMVETIAVTSEPASNAIAGSASSYWANGAVQESNGNIYVNLGSQKSILSTSLTMPNTSFIPSAIGIYGSNDGSSWTLLKSVNLSSTTTAQSFALSSTDGLNYKYLKYQVSTWGSAKYWRVSDITVTVIDGSTPGFHTYTTTKNNIWLALTVASYAMIILGVVSLFVKRLGN